MFFSVCSVSATGPIARLIIFSTLEDNHSWIVIENLTNSKLRIGNYNIGGKRSVSLGTWGNIKQHKGIWYNLEAHLQYKANNNGQSSAFSSHVSAGKGLTSKDTKSLNTCLFSINRWSYIDNCSYFAKSIWNSVAKTKLSGGNIVDTPSGLAKSIKSKLSYYTTNRKLDAKNKDYVYYHTSKGKTSCPDFEFINGSSSSSFGSNKVRSRKENSNGELHINKNYYTSFN